VSGTVTGGGKRVSVQPGGGKAWRGPSVANDS
jgi:hypothetical protein